MGLLIENFPLMGMQLQNLYVSIKGRFTVLNSSFMYGLPNRYRIVADYFYSLVKDGPTLPGGSLITIDLDELPANFYECIYQKIKETLGDYVYTDD